MTLKSELQTGRSRADAAGQSGGQSFEELQALVVQQAGQLESLDAERNSLLSISTSLQEEVQQLRQALARAADAADDVENIVIEGVENDEPADALERITHERDELRTILRRREKGEAELRETVETLRAQLEERDGAAEETISKLKKALEHEQQHQAVLQAEGTARDTQLESARIESSQKDLDIGILREEVESARQQIADLQKLVEQGDERVRSLEDENQDTTRKSHEDLRRKNDIEKEMQGQIERLRKQLEQTTRDYQKSRAGAQEDLDNLRDELHAERQARAEERAQMAARQRELKEQLAAVATEHEVNFTRQSNVIEEAVDAVRNEERGRLQGVLDAHAATEEQLARVQQELQQAHAEMVVFRHQERERHQADIKLMEEHYRQAENTIKQMQTQLGELTRERDNALEEQNALLGKLNSLRGEVEIARGLMNAAGHGQLEDPLRLRKQLDEARKNVEIAVRLRAEAEAARDRLLNERDALVAQLDGGAGADVPLHIPSLDEFDTPSRSGLHRHDGVRSNPGGGGLGQAIPVQQTDTGGGQGHRRLPGWLGGLAGLLVAGLIAAAGWWLVTGERPDPGDGAGGEPERALADTEVTSHPGGAASEDGPSLTAPPEVSPRPLVTAPPQRAPSPDGDSGRMPDQQADGSATANEAAVEDARQDGEAKAVTPVTSTSDDRSVVPESRLQKSTRSARQTVLRTFRDKLKTGGEGPVMVELALAGYFMGSYGNSLNYEEGPRHLVKLPGFSIGKYEVTFAEYDRFARATGRRMPHDETWGRGERPVINVSWSDAQAYTKWLSDQTGHAYRLPSEAEWEYAVRGGSYWMYWWMDAEDAVATDGVWANCHNCGSEWDGARTAPVGRFPANSYGLHDMTGNVQEWVADCYHVSYDGAPQDGSAWNSPFCTQRVIRGGGYTSPLDTLRSAKRGQLNQETRLDNLGFRVVRDN